MKNSDLERVEHRSPWHGTSALERPLKDRYATRLARDGTVHPGGDLASTRVAKPEVHAELQSTRKTGCKPLVANDDNYALAA
jgi:hypothetical protein